MLSGVLQLTEFTAGGDCLEVTIDDNNAAKLQSKERPTVVVATITRQAPLQQLGVEPDQPKYLKIHQTGMMGQGYPVTRILTPGPYRKDNVIEFEIGLNH